MEKKSQFKTIREGAVELMAPDNLIIKGPGTRTAGFYNMDQKLNRDITISFLRTVKPKIALDAFGGTGVRGIRINREAGIKAVISEINKKSYEYININRELNNSPVEVYNKTFQAILNDYLFDYIDIDLISRVKVDKLGVDTKLLEGLLVPSLQKSREEADVIGTVIEKHSNPYMALKDIISAI